MQVNNVRIVLKKLSGRLFHCKLFLLQLSALKLIVSTGGIPWILWFNVRYSADVRREIFGVTTLRGKLHQLGSPNLQDIFIGR